MSQNDIYAPTTICLVYGKPYVNDGFEYYLTKKEKRDTINHKAWTGMSQELTKYETIYCVYYHSKIDSKPFLENGYIDAPSNKTLSVKKYTKK